MKATSPHQYQARKENRGILRTTQQKIVRDVVASQTFGMPSESANPVFRAVWSVIDDRKCKETAENRRRKRCIRSEEPYNAFGKQRV